MPSSTVQLPRPRGSGLVRRMRAPRTIGCVLGGLCVGAALLQHGAAPWLWLLLALHGLAWPHIAFAWASRSGSPLGAEHRNLLIDSLLGGFWLPAMGFNLLPSVLVLAMTTMDNVAVGGARLLLRGLLAQAAGAAAGLALVGMHFEFSASLPTLLASLPFLIAYPLTVGAVAHRLSMRLAEQKRDLERSESLQRNTLDAMEAGIALYDAQDRLVLGNREFRELWGGQAGALEAGRRFEDVLRSAVACGLAPEAAGREEDWIRERLGRHEQAEGTVLRELPGNRWRRVVERRLPDGSLLAFSTDVTDLVRSEQAQKRLVEQRDAYAAALRQTNGRLELLAATDELTGLANRRRFDRVLQEEWLRAQRHGLPLALLLIDVDHFKRFNDAHGHPSGDDCLRRIALLLQGCVQRTGDLVARWGGEEFALLLPHADERAAFAVARRCLAAVRQAAIGHGASPVAPTVTLSIGVAVARPCDPAQGEATLVRQADAALYQAKRSGRDRAVGVERLAEPPP